MTIDFSMAEKYGGTCNLRYDDTNPTKEGTEYADAIEQDIRWLGFQWDKLVFGSSYFDQCYELAKKLIRKGVAYVDDLTKEEMKAYRGTLTEPGKNSPWRDRSVEENLDLFERMKNGSSRTERRPFGPRSTWPPPTSTCGTRPSTGSSTSPITRRGTSGASTPCTTSPTPSRTPSKA